MEGRKVSQANVIHTWKIYRILSRRCDLKNLAPAQDKGE